MHLDKKELFYQKVNRMGLKIHDVEGFEYFVLKGLVKTIKKHNPTIVFEYDKNYQRKTNQDSLLIFELLESLGYRFQEIKRNGLAPINNYSSLISCDVLALPSLIS